MRTPTIGRIVRYVLPANSGFPGDERPAMVTGVFGDQGFCNLTVFYNQKKDVAGLDLDDHAMQGRAWSCAYDEDKSRGTWHWPERV